jgi:hypothetical protein
VTPEDVERERLPIAVPSDQPWLFQRAIALYRLLRDQPSRE